MDTAIEQKPKIRREKKNIVVEENVKAVRWPQECVGCGSTAVQFDSILLKEKYKAFGEIQVQVEGIPYCQACFAKSRSGARLNLVVWIITFVLAIPLSALFILQSYSQQSGQGGIVWCSMIFLFTLLFSYGLVWFLVKLPAKAILRKRILEPVTAWLIEEKKSDGKNGISLVLSIPNPAYALKFAALNS